MEFLSNLTNWEIVGIILLVLIFGGFLWRVAKRLFGIAIIALLILGGIYLVKPEILHNWFGKENVHKIENKVKDETDKAQKKVQEKTTEVLDNTN